MEGNTRCNKGINKGCNTEISNSVIATQKLLEDANKLLFEKNKKYYNDVLDFMNLLFEDNAKILSKVKFKKITLSVQVFELYNIIIKTYKLQKSEFIIENFNLNEIEDLDEMKKVVCDIALKISNNLLEKINYKLKKKFIKNENKTIFILQHNI